MKNTSNKSFSSIPRTTKKGKNEIKLISHCRRNESLWNGEEKLEWQKETEKIKENIDAIFKMIHGLKKNMDELHHKIADK